MNNLIHKFASLYLEEKPLEQPVSNNFDGSNVKVCKDCSYEHVYPTIEDYAENCTGYDTYDSDEELYDILIEKSPTEIKYELPPYFKEFHSMFPNGVGWNKTMFNDKLDGDYDIRFLCNYVVNINTITHIYEFQGGGTGEFFFIDEWLTILEDNNSIDNGCGSILLNCCPTSKYYGKLLYYSSEDEGVANISKYGFDIFMEIMIDAYDLFSSNINVNSRTKKYIDNRNGHNYTSIVDWFNYESDASKCYSRIIWRRMTNKLLFKYMMYKQNVLPHHIIDDIIKLK